MMYVKDCAYALGIVDMKVLKDKSISTTIRWNRVYNDLIDINKIVNIGKYKDMSVESKKTIRDKMKTMKVTQEDIIMWSKMVNNDISNDFIQLMTKLNINNTESIIIKEYKSRDEIEFFKLLNPIINSLGYEIINQYSVSSYRIDGYIPQLKLAIEYDENEHKNYTYEKHEGRQEKIENKLGCKFIRVSDEYNYGVALGIVIKELFKYTVNIA